MLKNITWTVLSRYGAQGLAVVSNILLARHLGADGFGEYALASSVLLIGNAFTNFGMDMILIRGLASEADPSLLADGLWLQLILSGIYITAVFVIGLFISVPLSVKIYVFALLPLSFYSVFTIAIRARRQMGIFSLVQILTAFLRLLAVFLLRLLHGGIEAFAFLLLVSQIILAAWGFINHVLLITSWRFSFPCSLTLLKKGARMAVIGTLRLVYENMPATLLPALAGFSMTGLFASASRVIDAGKSGHFSAFTAIYPEMAHDGNFGRQMKGLRSLLVTALLISIFIFLLAGPAIHFLFGSGFYPAVLPLRILAWVVAPYVLVTYTSLGLVALGFERAVLTALLAALASLLFLLVVLVPRFGLTGSALAVLIAEFLQAVLLWRQWRIHVLSKLP